MRSGAKGGGQGWTVLLADDSKGVHGKSISPATSPRGRSLLWFTLRLRLGDLGFVDVDSLACRSALGLKNRTKKTNFCNREKVVIRMTKVSCLVTGHD